jgi:adenine-specific DNA-methyltransferase
MSNQKEAELYKKIQDLEYELGRLKKKKYGLVWEDKPEKFDKESQNALPVLKDKGGKFKDIITNPKDEFNVLIEGDNYHSLSVLSYTHKGKVDVIYIDPPYNRGGDFRYNDSYIDKEDPYRHSKWLSFMKKRLSISKDLLKNDGVMFISIDDSEQAQLKLLCQDIFGEDNVENYIWQLGDFTESSFTKTASNTVRFEHEYLIACYKNNKRLGRYEEYRFGEREDFTNPDNDPRGLWMSGNISRNGITSTTGSKYFTITTPTGKKYTRNWTVSKEEFEELVKDNRIYFSKNGDGVPRIKIFKNEPSRSIQSSVFSGLKTSITGKNQLKKIFKGEEVFDFPKPVDLIKRIIEISTNKNSIILDFMAGSGTTGQAVLELNEKKGVRS